MISSIIYIIGGLIEAILGLRIVFQLIGANPTNQFVSMIYDISTPFVAPFSGIVGQDATIVSGVGAVANSTFDWAAVIALLVVGILMAIVGGVVGRRRTVV